MDVFERMLELSRQGFDCAQILLSIALELEGKQNPDLVRAMGGLTGGVGNTGLTCGALTGGACLLAYFAGRGEPDELPHPALGEMQKEFAAWFAQYAQEYGGTDCNSILAGDPRNKMQRCPLVVQAAFESCMELLERHGVL